MSCVEVVLNSVNEGMDEWMDGGIRACHCRFHWNEDEENEKNLHHKTSDDILANCPLAVRAVIA